MLSHTQAAIISIAVIIPLSSFAVMNSAKLLEFDDSSMNSSLLALTSFYPLYEFTKQVGGDKVEVSILVPPGIEPHDWEPTIQDLQRIQQADIIVINGIGFEDWIEDLDLINNNALIVDSSQGISLLEKEPDDNILDRNEEDLSDPHIWLNPVLAKTQVNNIAEALVKVDPQNEKYYQENALSYNERLDQIDQKIRSNLSDCKKDFIAFHNAFSYFADEYGLNQHTVISSNEPHDEPTSKSLQNVIDLARNLDIKIIFTEEAIDPRTSQIIADEIGGKVSTLSPIEVIDYQNNYIGLMEQNLSNLEEALCS